MSSNTNATQSSKLSITQKMSISIEVERSLEIEGGGSMTAEQISAIVNSTQFDITSIISQVLGYYNPASLGTTDISGSLTISGDAVLENLDSTTVNTELLTIGDITFGDSNVTGLAGKITILENNFNIISTNIDDLSLGLYQLDLSSVKYSIFYDLSSTVNNLGISFNDLSDVVTRIEASFNLLYNDISGVRYDIFTDLSDSHYTLKTVFDNSAILSNVFDELSSNFYSNFLELSSNFYQLSGDFYTNFPELSSNFYQLSGDFYSNFAELSSNFYELDGKFFDLSKNFYDLSGNYYIFKGSFDELSGNFYELSGNHNTLQQSMNDISFIYTYFELSDDRIIVKLPLDISNKLILNNDFSYASIAALDNSNNNVLTLGQINQLLASYNFSTTEGSNNTIFDISSVKEYVNDVSQTFYEIMTQQPYRFDTSGIPDSTSSSAITLAWNYDNILAYHDNSVFNAQLSFNQDTKITQLPYINNITIDISGIANSSSTGWINHSSITIPDDVSYNSNTYKQLTINKFTGNNPSTDLQKILSALTAFDIRIYGNNYAINYPIVEDRAIIFNNIAFTLAGVPSQPLLQSMNISQPGDVNRIVITYRVVNTEDGVPSSQAVLTEIVTKYNIVESLRSIKYSSLDSTVLTDIESLSNINNNQNFGSTIISLFSGAKYDIEVQVQNDLNSTAYSVFSDISRSDYTLLPDSDGKGTTINTNITGNKENITTSSTTTNLNNSNQIYINLAENNDDITYNNSSTQTIEITKPYSSTQQNTTTGFGKFIDNSLNLVNIMVSVDGVSKQNIIYDGSFDNVNARNIKLNSNTFDYISLPGTSLQDMYSTNTHKGYRLKGNFNLVNITNSTDISNHIGPASSTPYSLKFDYTRHADVGGTSTSNSYDIYVDDYGETPQISSSSNSSNVVSVLYNFGIPSVKEFDLSFSRTYSKINSQYMYILSANSNRIAYIGGIGNTSTTSTKNITLNSNEIVSTGIYSYNDTKMDTETSNYYNSINYTSYRLTSGTNNKVSWSEGVYNIYTSQTGIAYNHITNHYCDHNSFSKTGNQKINNQNIVATTIYEIDNISLFGSNLGGLQTTQYTNHNSLIKDSTLLYLDGKFRTNASQAYPNVSDFSYNGVSIPNLYNAGQNTFNLSGTDPGDNSGYKWLTIKYNMQTDKSSHNTNSGTFNYLNIYQKLTNSPFSFSNDILTKLRLDGGGQGSSENEVIGFIQQEYNGSNRIGRLDRNFKSTAPWYNEASNISYNTIFFGVNRANFGSNYEETTTNWGPLLDINNGSNDIFIFIGFKNNVSLS